MTKFDTGAALAQLAGSLPTLIAVLLAWMHSNGRLGDLNANFNQRINDLRSELKDVRSEIKDVRAELKENIKSEASLVRSEFRRVEEVMDARLKHLEEREH